MGCNESDDGLRSNNVAKGIGCDVSCNSVRSTRLLHALQPPRATGEGLNRTHLYICACPQKSLRCGWLVRVGVVGVVEPGLVVSGDWVAFCSVDQRVIASGTTAGGTLPVVAVHCLVLAVLLPVPIEARTRLRWWEVWLSPGRFRVVPMRA